jgi:hypothetical protein
VFCVKGEGEILNKVNMLQAIPPGLNDYYNYYVPMSLSARKQQIGWISKQLTQGQILTYAQIIFV